MWLLAFFLFTWGCLNKCTASNFNSILWWLEWERPHRLCIWTLAPQCYSLRRLRRCGLGGARHRRQLWGLKYSCYFQSALVWFSLQLDAMLSHHDGLLLLWNHSPNKLLLLHAAAITVSYHSNRKATHGFPQRQKSSQKNFYNKENFKDCRTTQMFHINIYSNVFTNPHYKNKTKTL